MRAFEMHKYLQQHGFSLRRHGAKHAIYSNGDEELTVPRGGTIERRLSKHIRIVVRKAKERKTAAAAPAEKAVQEGTQKDNHVEEGVALISKKKTTIYQRVLDYCTKLSGTAASLTVAEIMEAIGEREADFLALVTAIRKAEDIDKLFGLRDALEAVGVKHKRIQKGIEEFERFTRPGKVRDQTSEGSSVEEMVIITEKAEVRAPMVQMALPTPGIVVKNRDRAYSEKQIVYLDIVKLLVTLPEADAKQVLELAQGFITMR